MHLDAPNHRIGKKGNLSDFKRGIVVGARWAGLIIIQQTTIVISNTFTSSEHKNQGSCIITSPLFCLGSPELERESN